VARFACAFGRACRFLVILVVALSGPSVWAAETTQYTYDALGRVVSAVDASGKKVAYTYDSAGNRTRVSNGAEFSEIIPSAWSASSNAGTTGLTATNGMRDGGYSTTASIHATNVETNAWVKADLGSVQNVNHIDVTAAIESTIGATPASLNDTAVEYSTDGTIWNMAAAIEGVSPGASRTVTLGGVALRYLRIHRIASGRVAIGDLRLYSSAAANTPLIANPDTITSAGSAVTFDPRANDVDQDGYSIAVSTVDTPVHGTAVINSGVSITYTPVAGYYGADSFAYTVTDGHNGAAGARVSVTVRSATNHSPVAVNDSFAVGDRATSSVDGTNALRPLVNDYDADGDVLTITATTAPSHGTISVVGSGQVNYQPSVGYDGSDSFTYTVGDGRGGSSTATVSLSTANSPPVAGQDSLGTSSGRAVTADPRLNDNDPNGDAISVTAITQPANGTATLNADQTVTYTPNTSFVGGDSFTYTLTDARGATATGLIVAVVAPNQSPVAVNDNITAVASTPVTFDPRSNDSDPENRPLTVVSLTAPTHGTATIASGGAAVTYTMTGGYSGVDNFTYTISDDQGVQATATVTVNSFNIDYLVVGAGGAGGARAGTGGGGGQVVQGSSVFTIGSTSISVGAGGAATSTNGNAGGSSSLGAIATATGGAGGAAYAGYGGSGAGGAATPPYNWGSGGNAGGGGPGLNLAISGTSVNYAAGGGGGGDTDDDTYYFSGGVAGGASAHAGTVYSGDPAPNAPANQGGGGGGGGAGGIPYSPIGGAGGSGVVILRYLGAPKATGGTISQVGGYTIHTFTAGGAFAVTSANTAPTAVNDSLSAPSGLPVSFDPRTNDSDTNGDAITVASVGAPSYGTAVRNASGTAITYTATLGYTGSDSFTYTIGDGQGLTSTATVSVTVSGGHTVDYLVVGGGGGGGGQVGGGGGGGQVRQGTFAIASGAYAITVGAGGAGNATSDRGANGQSSALANLVSSGGGGGGAGYNGAALSTGANGGGGGNYYATAGTSASDGFPGGPGVSNTRVSGGGGGASEAGMPGYAPVNGSGRGGAGVVGTITGLSYGGGGGGGAMGGDAVSSPGPAGDSSATAGSTANASAAPANRGGGGGGGGLVSSSIFGVMVGASGDGGSGVVVIRYATGSMIATGGTVTTSGGYTIHTFTSSGTFTAP